MDVYNIIEIISGRKPEELTKEQNKEDNEITEEEVSDL